jgi:hypothetical protein
VFLDQVGCNGSPLLRGNVDGTSVGILFDTFIGQPNASSPVSAQNFLCSNRDPSGGFNIVVNDASDNSPRLYHIDEDAHGSSGVTRIDTVPSLTQAKRSNGEVFGFLYCSVATAQDGTIFIQTYHQLWKVYPLD